METEWVEDKIDYLGEAVESVIDMAKYVPESVYTGMQRVLEQEWKIGPDIIKMVRIKR